MDNVRPARLSDLPDIAEIENQAGFNGWNKAQIQECLERNHVWLGLCNSKIIAYAVFSLVLDETELLNIAVLPDYQNKGVAKQLLAYAFNDLIQQQASLCFLEVAVSNHKAIKVYEQLGFTQISLRKKYYKTVAGYEDALVMQLTLRNRYE